ncbi:NADPH:quinone oxidoreductase family protein [Pseudonocardia nematodicida]|uniref:NADPH:quinone oxidoreductase family protein n=1 Tax=Pseudonocardia nematodicida TaxID=1206997 RepID=A0ABV1K7M6_9PSEU
MICTEFGDPPLLEVAEGPDPRPRPGEVVIGVAAAGVSFVDGLIVAGGYQLRPALPFTPGIAVAGRIVATGDGVDRNLTGADVAAVVAGFGGYASHVAVPEWTAVARPPGVPAELAASVVESYLTLAHATTRRVTIRPGEQVVVLGAAGGIGLAAVDVVRSLGARVIGVASSPEKREAVLRAGADVALGYDDLKDSIREATGGGADVVVDPVGGATTETALRALGSGGRLCLLGFAAGEIPRIPANIVLLRNRSVVGVDWGDWSRQDAGRAGNPALLADVLGRIDRGELSPPAPAAVPLEDAGRVLGLHRARRAVGRHILLP